MALVARKNYVDIQVEKYPTTFFYEKMKISPVDFDNENGIKFFDDITKHTGKTNIATAIQDLLVKVYTTPPKKSSGAVTTGPPVTGAAATGGPAATAPPVTGVQRGGATVAATKLPIGVASTEIIFKYIFKYNIQQLWYNNRNTVFIFPTISTSNDKGLKLLVKPSDMYKNILEKKDPFKNPSMSCLPKPDDEQMNGEGNTIEYLDIISEDDEDVETFKTRIDSQLKIIKQKIIDRETANMLTTSINESSAHCKQFRKIIYFVNKTNNEEDPMFIKYYKKGIKKELISALKEQLNKYFNNGKMGEQRMTFNNSLPDANNIEKITKDTIIRDLKKSDYGFKQEEINEHIDNIQILLERLKMFYKRETDENFKKSITSSDNSNIFNLFMRFNNLDTPVITDEIIANRDALYEFKENGTTKIGFFYVSNLDKRQYIFNLDLIENKKYKIKHGETKKPEPIRLAAKTNSEKQKENQNKDDEEEDERKTANLEEALIVNPALEIKDSSRKTLVEVKLEFGRLTFRNIQKDIKSKYKPDNEIKYYGQRKGYEYYRWFNHRMIDTSLPDNINIRFFSDTVYDLKTFKAYLNSENKLSKDTRIPLEFLKVNSSPELLKYNDYIFNNFKDNINDKLYLLDDNSYKFEEKIKKGIVDILFEKNSLVYIKEIKQVSEKEKEEATPQNYKIINTTYVPIYGTPEEKEKIVYSHFQKKVTTTVNEIELNYYKNPTNLKLTSAEAAKDTAKDAKQAKNTVKKIIGTIPPELSKETITNKKKTFGILVVDVSKDVFSNPVSLYLAAECKSRSKRLKDTYYNFKKYFSGGSTKKRKRKITKKKNRYTKAVTKHRLKSKSKPKKHVNYRRI
jgi:hypothetical protein